MLSVERHQQHMVCYKVAINCCFFFSWFYRMETEERTTLDESLKNCIKTILTGRHQKGAPVSITIGTLGNAKLEPHATLRDSLGGQILLDAQARRDVPSETSQKTVGRC